MRYERSREALAHGRILTQRHEATDAELAMAEGDRPLVRVSFLLCDMCYNNVVIFMILAQRRLLTAAS
jgi:hypothetical protein